MKAQVRGDVPLRTALFLLGLVVVCGCRTQGVPSAASSMLSESERAVADIAREIEADTPVVHPPDGTEAEGAPGEGGESSAGPEATDRTSKEEPGARERDFVIAPLVLSSPAFGSGAGVAGMFFYRPAPDDNVSPPSFVGFGGAYSNTDSYLVGAFNQNYLREDHWRLGFGVGGGRINNDLDIPILGSVKFRTNVVGAFLRSDWRVKGNWFLGVKTGYFDASFEPRNAAARAYFNLFDVEDTSSGYLGVVASYDSRDNPHFPYDGVMAEFGLTLTPDWLGAEESYHVVEGETNLYHQLRPRHVLALRAYGRFTPSGTPYVGLSTLGRGADLRGYVPSENVAENLLSFQAEYRWMFAKKWAVVGFGGVATLYDGNLGNMNSDDVFFSGGVGIRYLLHEKNRVYFRVDYAWGEDDESGFYVSIREAF